MPNIFKIVDSEVLAEAREAGHFSGAGIDLQDGYIHFSTAAQVRETARLHFAGRDGLVIFAVPSERLGDALKWEASRGGQLFPHLYDVLQLADIAWDKPLPWNGVAHDFPPEVFA